MRLRFSDVFNASKLPTPPAVFGHSGLMPSGNWFMLANDQYGDCVFAGAAHEHMLWTMEGGAPRSRFTIHDVLSDYAAVTGFDPKKPDTDQGTDMQVAASYRRKTGIVDATGKRHQIGAYVALRTDDTSQLALATWLFGAVGVGLEMPESAEQQFVKGVPWSVKSGDKIVGGHYVPCVGRDANGNFLVITWGRVHPVTPEFIEKYMDEGVAYLSIEILSASKMTSPEGFDIDALNTYLARLT